MTLFLHIRTQVNSLRWFTFSYVHICNTASSAFWKNISDVQAVGTEAHCCSISALPQDHLKIKFILHCNVFFFSHANNNYQLDAIQFGNGLPWSLVQVSMVLREWILMALRLTFVVLSESHSCPDPHMPPNASIQCWLLYWTKTTIFPTVNT